MCELLPNTGHNYLAPFGWNMDPAPSGHFLAQVQDQMIQKETSKPNRKKKKLDLESPSQHDGKNAKGGSKKYSRVRTSFSQDQQQELETYFADCMYPNASEIQKLSKKLGLNETTVQVWFQNRRAKWRKPLNLTGIPGRPSASRMNNEQLYKRNPKFIEMQTRAILLQNNRHSASSPLENSTVAGSMVGEECKNPNGLMSGEGHLVEGTDAQSPMKRPPQSILPMPQSTSVPWMGGSNTSGISSSADSVLDGGAVNPNGAPQLIWYPRQFIYLPPGPAPQQPSIMCPIVPLPPDATPPKSTPNFEITMDNPNPVSSPSDFNNMEQANTVSGLPRTSHSIGSLSSISPHGSNDHLSKSGESSRHGSRDKISGFHDDLQNGRMGQHPPMGGAMNPNGPGGVFQSAQLDRSYSIPSIPTREKFNNPPSQQYPSHVMSHPNLPEACSAPVMHPSHHQHTLSSTAHHDLTQSQPGLQSGGGQMGSNTSIGQEQPMQSCMSQPVIGQFAGEPTGHWGTSSTDTIYTSRSSVCQDVHPPPYSNLRDSPKLRSASGIPDLLSNPGGFARSPKTKSYNFPASSYQSLGNLPQEVQRNGNLYRDIHHQDSTGSLANDSNSASLHSLQEQGGSSSSINITMTDQGYRTMDLPPSQLPEYNQTQPGTPYSLGTPTSHGNCILDDLTASGSTLSQEKGNNGQRRYSSPIVLGSNRSSLTPMATRRISGGPPNVEVATSRTDHHSQFF